MATRSAGEDIRKVLFKEKSQYVIGTVASQKTSDLQSTKVGIQFEHDVEVSLSSLEKELHEQRLQKLRAISEKLKEDAWKYEPIEKLLGM
ncbi:anaphase-promoting complex subunit 16-like [Dermacentor silvarum]|uniref:anaphase-promoting complex subunit 16-like n=1 Tax=Dermacentor silvarum TaxID=543639 RepID=UPI00189724A7|nr:anaphase-promoting complex subunit 16-like [Dermacentor silvarum]